MAGYEISGFEKIPDEGPALLVYYHGAIPIDLYYLMANVILHKQRYLRAVGDRFLFVIPGNVQLSKSLLLLQTSFLVFIFHILFFFVAVWAFVAEFHFAKCN